MFLKSLLFVLLMLATSLQADYITVYDMDGNTQTFMYHDINHAKVINKSGRESSSVYRIDKKIYLVSKKHGRTEVIDMDEMKKMMSSLGSKEQIKRDKKESMPKYSIKKTGKRVTVAGIKGEVWIVSGKEEGESFKETVVVTKDKRVVKTEHAKMKLFLMMGDSEEDAQNIFEIEKGYVTIKADGMILKSFKEKDLPKSEYKLPKDIKINKATDMLKSFF